MGGADMGDNDEKSKSDRRAFLLQCGRFAVITPPVVSMMLSVSDKAAADNLDTSAVKKKTKESDTTTKTTTTKTTTTKTNSLNKNDHNVKTTTGLRPQGTLRHNGVYNHNGRPTSRPRSASGMLMRQLLLKPRSPGVYLT